MIKYRKLRFYKYQLVEDDETILQMPISEPIQTEYITLIPTEDFRSKLIIRKGYAWDGASGPGIDTKTNMRGALIHDALYQLMRSGLLPYNVYKNEADRIGQQICLEDGMIPFRAWLAYWLVRLFGLRFCKPQPDIEQKIYTAGK